MDERILPSSEVIIHGKRDIKGVIGSKPPHLQSVGENEKAMKLEDMYIDTGYDKNELKEIVQVGTAVTMAQSVGELKCGSISLKALDDRAGVAVIISVMKEICEMNLEADIYAVATVQEELGLRGARVAASHIIPGCAIAIDVCHGESADVRDDAFPCGNGPVVTVGPNLHTKFTKMMLNQAKKNSIDIQLEACSGDTGTDAWEIQTAACGIPTALISIPVRYMHSNYEVASTDDIEATAKIIAFTIKELKDGECLCF
jgi:endoglucanase